MTTLGQMVKIIAKLSKENKKAKKFKKEHLDNKNFK